VIDKIRYTFKTSYNHLTHFYPANFIEVHFTLSSFLNVFLFIYVGFGLETCEWWRST